MTTERTHSFYRCMGEKSKQESEREREIDRERERERERRAGIQPACAVVGTSDFLSHNSFDLAALGMAGLATLTPALC